VFPYTVKTNSYLLLEE